MDDYILPDDESMQKLSAEYAKIKAKTFCEDKAQVLSAPDGAPNSRDAFYCLPTLISALILYSILSK